MSVRNLLEASQTASSSLRAENAGALARAYLQGECVGDERDEVEGFLFALLDDPSALVRRALAESLASAEGAPPELVLGLACDQSDIAALVLSRSPLLSDEQLIDCAAIGESRRPDGHRLAPSPFRRRRRRSGRNRFARGADGFGGQ